LPNQANLSLNLQNQGAGSAGIQLGGGNVLGNLALMSAGNVNQSGAITAQSLLVQGGATSRFDLSNPGNQFGVLAFDPPQFLSVATQGNLTVDAASALGCDVAGNTFSALNISNSVAGTQTVLRSIAGDLRLNRSIRLPVEGASSLDLVTPASFVAGEGVNITGPVSSRWRVWTQAPANVTRGNLQAANLYGCAFGDTAACSLSGVALPGDNRFIFVDRPLLTVTANPASGVSGQGLPALTYAFSGVVNGDAAESVLGGALATAATSTSRQGTYAITQGTLTSPLGYRLQFQGADLTLSAPPYNIQDPTRQALQAGFLSDQRSDVYGRNLALPYICTAASATAKTAADGSASDPLASEWGKVRGLPQLSGCLDVKDEGQCAAF
jgi:MBG domain (YGX type)